MKKSDKKTEGKQTVQNETKTVKEEVKKSETEETQKKPAVNKTNTEKKEKERASSSK